ncbi:MAG TPA: methyltransferase domain-containing protein [Capsulimonadaceae bacterium]|nr:methyltransferase domain-containing protein [Capsulimonadaceae bacterium]
MDYDKFDNSQYDKARALPPETMIQWADAIGSLIDPMSISTVVDLGCGTGRFTTLLASVFCCYIVGIDPSEKMLARAARQKSDLIRFLQGSAESIRLADQSADLLFLSMVWHHLENVEKAFAEFTRVLLRPGYVFLRTATQETNDLFEYHKCFPEALEMERRRMPARAELMRVFEQHGFTTIVQTSISQKFAGNPQEYYEKISLRGLSSLQALPDDVFQRGLVAFKRYCDALPPDHPIYEPVDFFAFQLGT